MRRQSTKAGFLALAVSLVLAAGVGAGPAEPSPPARMEVSGYGFFGNRSLLKMLRRLQPPEKAPSTFPANAVEDAAMVLLSQLTRDGYLKPRLKVTLTLTDGSVMVRDWDEGLELLLPRPLEARRVWFHIHSGALYYYDRIAFVGLESITPEVARQRFAKDDFLFRSRSTRIYTPARFQQALAGLRGELTRQGLEHVDVRVGMLDRNDRTGAVQVEIAVKEGLQVNVRSVTVQTIGLDANVPTSIETRHPDKHYSRYFLQDLTQELKNEQYRRGFPDVSVEVTEQAREREGQVEQLDLVATVRTGPHVRIGQVRFEGNRKTSRTALRERARLRSGNDLNPIRVEQTRQRLSRLGVFNAVDVNYAGDDPTTRDVIYSVKEGKTMDLSLLMGYGSYETLRGGFELEQYNLWGRAHNARLRAVQSFKSSQVDYLYNMPDLIGEEVNLFLGASALRREEVSFLREEGGVSLGVQRYLEPIHSDVRVRYNYQFLNASDIQATTSDPLDRARAAALVFDLTHDRLDNPLLPRSGYKALANLEVASALLGGDVDYDRLELAVSGHLKLGGGRFLHLGLSHGVVFTTGGTKANLPFNKRFFPGGEDSVRGFQQGQASPRDGLGRVIGAETYVLGNIELEQMLTPAWSIVGFVDGVGVAADLADYPASEGLFSAGGGIRFKTLIGPVRLEYGRVLNPRPYDPSGTLHLTIGFPF